MNKYKQVLKHFEIIFELFFDVLYNLEAILKRFWTNVRNFQNVLNNWRTFGEQSEAKHLGGGKIHSYNHEFLLMVKNIVHTQLKIKWYFSHKKTEHFC